MKDNKGITLSALIIIIVLLVIFTTFAIYSSVESFKLIDIQKYKTQMQLVQNGLDDFYEEYKNSYEKNKTIINNSGNEIFISSDQNLMMEIYISYLEIKDDSTKLNDRINNWKNDYFEETATLTSHSGIQESYGKYLSWIVNNFTVDKTVNGSVQEGNLKTGSGLSTIQFSDIQSFREITTSYNFWDPNIAKAKYGITIDENKVKEQYFLLTKDQVKTLFNIEELDVSENFIINFQKRYAFTNTPINVNKKDGTGNENVYCLYEFAEEEKVVEYKVENVGGALNVEIVKMTAYNQTLKMTLSGQETKIKQVYHQPISGLAAGQLPPTIEECTEFVEEVTGLGTDAVYVTIREERRIFIFS